ncbi:hypothetical protein L0F40_02135 [Klebsiella pneumoniae]|uniref:hypothetical protein n=1 Tax=Klebsiella pneumoniae TaxID=573 RepID=UPI000C7D85FA|nr:hypothetical protein [Klebsiella pneumoniae]MCF0366433.1 hypothetical protein [Klebsiella pneumoniae]PLE09995.1 hypothetical protein B6I66_14245 [Klebsiella pneumoniae]HBY6201959.1 hypothetical protein [Klebsiella pneumoniae]
MNNLKEMIQLINEKYLNSNNKRKGDLGEALAITHFEETNQGFIHVHQEDWSYPNKMREKNAQRPDFYMLPMGNKITAVDVKHWELNDNLDFELSSCELLKYIELQLYLMEIHSKSIDDCNDILIKFFVIPSQFKGDAYAEVSLHEMVQNELTLETNAPSGNVIKNIIYRFSIKDRLIKIGTKSDVYNPNETAEAL